MIMLMVFIFVGIGVTCSQRLFLLVFVDVVGHILILVSLTFFSPLRLIVNKFNRQDKCSCISRLVLHDLRIYIHTHIYIYIQTPTQTRCVIIIINNMFGARSVA